MGPIPRRALTLALALAVGGVVAEVLLRQHYPFEGSLYELDPELIHKTVPNRRRIQIMPPAAGGARVLVALNSLGMRGPEPRGAQHQLLLVGDSLVLAANVSFSDTFGLGLERYLQQTGSDWEVLQAGAESYGPDQTLIQLRRQLPQLQTAGVVLVLCAHNDFGDIIRNKLFGIDSEGRLQLQKVELGPALTSLFQARQLASSKPALWRAWTAWRKQEQAGALDPSLDYVSLYLRAARSQYQDGVVTRSPIVDDVQRDTWDADLALYPDWPSSVYKRKLMTLVLKEIAETCRGSGVPLAVIVVPSAIDIGPDSAIQVNPEFYRGYDPRRLSGALSACAVDAGIPTLDLTEEFLGNDPSTLFVSPEDFHWNARAQALAAKACAAFLAELGWF